MSFFIPIMMQIDFLTQMC